MAVKSEIKIKNDVKVKKEITRKEKILLKQIRYKMPNEIGGREITFLKKKIPSKIFKIIETMFDEKNFELIEMILPDWLVDPKVTKKNMYDVLPDFEEIMLILLTIIEENTITGDRLQELRKKVKKL